MQQTSHIYSAGSTHKMAGYSWVVCLEFFHWHEEKYAIISVQDAEWSCSVQCVSVRAVGVQLQMCINRLQLCT